MRRSKLPRLRHQRPVRLLPVIYRHSGVSASDAFLASYPKSGNTWLKFMLTELLGGREADLDNDSTVIADVGSHRSTPRVLPGHGRLIKSHEPFFGPQRRVYRKAIYLIRDGRDVAVSYYYTLIRRGLFEGEFSPFLRLFLDGGADGYGPWHRHVESWLASPLAGNGSLLALKYEDMLADPVEKLTEATGFLGVSVEPERAEETVRAYSAERMRERERDSRFHEQKKRPDIMFVRTAGAGDWTQLFTDRDEALFAEVTGGLLGRLGYDA
ncbi:MAG: sulfotransferase domain-containing protein [Solirubrobacterales bacterium]